MSQGIQVFSSTGLVTLDVQDRLLRMHSTHTVTSGDFGPSTGFVSVPGMARDGRWLVISGAPQFTFSYFHVTAGAGGFNWVHSGFAGDTCVITVFRL